MCLTVFVGSDRPLPVITFDGASPSFNAHPLGAEQEFVRRIFAKPFVYGVGASSGCGCGFDYGPEDLDVLTDAAVPDEVKNGAKADHAARRESVRRLVD